MKRCIAIIFSFFISISTYSQIGGVYRFLDLPISSRTAALGGSNISIIDNDINFVLNNPSLLTDQTNGVLSLNYASYLADIKFGSAIYGYNINENNYLSVGVQYIDYGKFEGYDQFGKKREDFTAKDMALYLTYARPLNEYFTVGATLKPIASVYERYKSVGIVTDLGLNYNRDFFSASLVIRNLGVQLKGYYDVDNKQHREPLPFDVQLGLTKKFEYAPIRISITANNLHRWDVANYSTKLMEKVSLDGIKKEKKISAIDMAFRHLTIGVEFIPSEKFYIAAGYNHRRNQEMSIDGFKSLAGFSFGAGIKLYKFQVGFGMTQYQVKNYAYQFSISTNLSDFVSF